MVSAARHLTVRSPEALLILLLAVSAAPAAAQTPAPYRPLSVTTNIGFVNTAGNSSITTLSLDEKLSYKPDSVGGWDFAQYASSIYSKTDSATSANQLKIGGRAGHAITRRLQGFVAGSWERNRFAGIARRFQEDAGLGYQALDGAKDKLSFEAGVSFSQERSTADSMRNWVLGRVAGDYKRMLTASAYFEQTAEFLPNFSESKGYRFTTQSSLVAPISRQLGVKLGYLIRYNNLPETGFKKTDRIFTSGLQITL